MDDLIRDRLRESLALDDGMPTVIGTGTGPVTAVRLATWVPVTDETLIDMGMADAATIERDALRRREREAAFRSLPWHVRFGRRQVWWRIAAARHRLGHAANALRGIDCERDY